MTNKLFVVALMMCSVVRGMGMPIGARKNDSVNWPVVVGTGVVAGGITAVIDHHLVGSHGREFLESGMNTEYRVKHGLISAGSLALSWYVVRRLRDGVTSYFGEETKKEATKFSWCSWLATHLYLALRPGPGRGRGGPIYL